MSYTQANVKEAWNKSVGRPINWKLKEVEAHDGRKQTQLLNPEGTIVVAVNLIGEDAYKKLVENAGVTFLDAAFSQPEIDGPNQANQLDKADDNVKKPATNPGPAVEAEKGKDAGKLKEDRK